MPDIPTTMRQWQISGFDSIDRLGIHEGVPTPVATQPGQILVKVHAVTIESSDLQTMMSTHPGIPSKKFKPGVVPGKACACEIVQIADGAMRSWKVGDRVMPIGVKGFWGGMVNREILKYPGRGSGRDGTLREFMVVDEGDLVQCPEGYSWEDCAALAGSYLTSWTCLYNTPASTLRPGQWVLIQGTGGCSLGALQIAKFAGAKAIVTSSSDEKLEKAKGLGAVGLINYKKTPDWEVEVMKITNGRGVDHVIEVGGGPSLPKSIKSLRLAGHIWIIGYLSDYYHAENETKYDVAKAILYSAATVKGVFVGNREQLEDLCEAFAANDVHPVLNERKFAFEEVTEAYHFLHSGKGFGKVVVRVSK